jgi:exodeoxyribonuclease III
VKLATYNVNGINGSLDVLLRWLAEAKPDVVCLQELKAPDERFPRREIERAGHGAIWHGQKSWNGVAILARDQVPRETRRGLPGDPDDSHSRYIEAATSAPTSATVAMCSRKSPWSRRQLRIGFRASFWRLTKIGNSVGPQAE